MGEWRRIVAQHRAQDLGRAENIGEKTAVEIQIELK